MGLVLHKKGGYCVLVDVQVNAFVHCFVGVQRITSLYDLEVAICKNEGVDDFEELGLGPFLRHPLVIHYFSLRSDVTQVYKITTEEIIQLLICWMYEKKGGCMKKNPHVFLVVFQEDFIFIFYL